MKIENYAQVQQLMEQYKNAVSNEGTYNRLIEKLMALKFVNATIVNISGIEVTLNRQQWARLVDIIKEAKCTESKRLQSIISDL